VDLRTKKRRRRRKEDEVWWPRENITLFSNPP